MSNRSMMIDCLTCGQAVDHRQATAHVGGCMRQNTGTKRLLRANGMRNGPPNNAACLIKVTGEEWWSSQHVAYFLVRKELPLNQMDKAIRALWMEPCCDEQHSGFFGSVYQRGTLIVDPAMEAAGMTLQETWQQTEDRLNYVFDLKNPTRCRISDYALYQPPWEDGIRLLARSQTPTIRCDGFKRRRLYHQCTNQATAACLTRQGRGHLYTRYACDECAERARLHWRSLLNSPRSGACGYGTALPMRARTPLRQMLQQTA